MKVADCKAKYILVTHGHSDHLGDTIEIAKIMKQKSLQTLKLQHIYPKRGLKNLVPMNIGGTVYFENFSVKNG